jgi:hypothetical protein
MREFEEIQNKIDSGENPTVNEVWNAAIEAAANKADYFSYEAAQNIRKLKK